MPIIPAVLEPNFPFPTELLPFIVPACKPIPAPQPSLVPALTHLDTSVAIQLHAIVPPTVDVLLSHAIVAPVTMPTKVVLDFL